MNKNVGGMDRAARVFLGSAFLAAAQLRQISQTERNLLLGLSAIALGTAFLAYCPVNALLNLNTATPSG